MHTETLNYQDGDTTLSGYVAFDDSHKEKRPLVMVCHAFEGRNDLACEYAQKIAELGYVGFAVDMYGDGQVANDLDGCLAIMMPFFEDRAKLRQRILAAFEAAKTIPVADEDKMAAMGFCFGGMCALDLARSGADIKGAVSIHGVFAAPENVSREAITAKVLALHGYQDPQIPPEQLTDFANEMNDAGVDWQVVFYGNGKHAFTDPHASEIGPPEMGREFNQLLADRAWRASKDFFEEIF